jgi:hypothetical protein
MQSILPVSSPILPVLPSSVWLSMISKSNTPVANTPNINISPPSWSPSTPSQPNSPAPVHAVSLLVETKPHTPSTCPCTATSHRLSPSYSSSLPNFPSTNRKPGRHPYTGASTQLTSLDDNSAPLNPAGLTRLRKIIGMLLYYAHAVGSPFSSPLVPLHPPRPTE